MTQAPPVPLHMQRDRFDPVRGAGPDPRARKGCASWRPASAPGLHGHPLRRRPRGAGRRQPVQQRRARSGRPEDTRTDEERERDRAGNLLALDPPEHSRLRRMLTPEFTVRRMRRLEPRIVEIVDDHLDALERAGAAGRPGADLRAAHPVAGDLRAARGALRRPRRVPDPDRAAAGPVASDGPAPRAGPGEPGLHGRAGGPGPGRSRRGHARHAGPRARPRADRPTSSSASASCC